MIAYHFDSNIILQAPFINIKDKHRIRAYNSIMQRLADRGHHVEVQILDNKVSAELKKTIVKDWNTSYQLVPPNMHRKNVAERAIRTFKAHFLEILAGVDPNFPKYMWQPLGTNGINNQPSETSNSQPKNFSMGILQWSV